VFLFVLGFANTYWLAVMALMLMGAMGAISMVAASAMQVVAGRRVGMGTVLGLGSAANGAGIVIGSVVGGLLVDQFDLSAAFVFGAVAMFAGVFVFMGLTRGVATNEPIEAQSGGRPAEQSAAS
jgi:MFS transporter, DHA1 family, multidrug resistance protein